MLNVVEMDGSLDKREKEFKYFCLKDECCSDRLGEILLRIKYRLEETYFRKKNKRYEVLR